MPGRHRKPPTARRGVRVSTVVRVAAGATTTALALLATTTVHAVTTPHPPVMRPTAHRERLAPVELPLPPLSIAEATRYLPSLPLVSVAPLRLSPIRAGHSVARDVVSRPVVTAPTTTETQTSTAVATTTGLTSAAVNAALGQTGVPYVYGGHTPGQALDCSALIQVAYNAAGVTLPRVAADQATVGRPVALRDILPGDLLTYDYGEGGITHVAMAIGGGMIVEASQPGHPVATRPIYTAHLAGIRRVIG